MEIALRVLQDMQMDMLAKLDIFCKLHNINYVLICGSALGAVRHGGMIPWDDDIDVGMLRADYERFTKAYLINPIDGIFLQNNDTDPEYPMLYAKLRKDGTSFLEINTKHLNIHKGVFIDVFPFDVYIGDGLMGRMQYYLLCICNGIRLSVTREICLASRSQTRKIIRLLTFFLRKIIPLRWVSRVEEKIMTMFSFSSSKSVCCFELYGLNNYRRSIFGKENMFPSKEVVFGSRPFPIPREYHLYLEMNYGDYMKLPPPQDRQPRHLACLDLGHKIE
ncbi:MAG: LicD family protein [Candidatus Accumulibacter propinquus]